MPDQIVVDEEAGIVTKGDSYEAPELHMGGRSREPEAAPEPRTVPVVDSSTGQSLVEAIKNLNAQARQETSAAKLLADPQIRAYLEAKGRGEQVTFATAKQQEVQIQAPEAPKDLENLSNADLIKYLREAMKTDTINAVQEIVGKQVTGLREEIQPQLQGLLGSEQGRIQNDVATQLKTLETKYSDFKEMRPIMAEVNSKVKGLNAEEIYLLAKLRSGQPLISQKEVESERSTTPRERRGTAGPRKVYGNTRQSFQEIMADHFASQE